MSDDRPLLVFRKSKGNRFTLPVLLGRLEETGMGKDFRVLLAGSEEEIAPQAGGRTALIGYSFMTLELEEVQREVQRLRRNLPGKAIFLAGGSHPTGDPEGTLGLGFDFVFSGEAEETLPDFLRRFLGGKLPPGGILEAENFSGRPLTHPPFSLEHRFFAPIEISRGCLYACTFCQTPRIFGRRLRHRPPENVAAALRAAIPHGFRQSAFISSNAFAYGSVHSREPNLGALEALLAACRETGLEGIHFGCYPSEVRPDWVTPGVLDLVKKYCRNGTVVLGAQSGSDVLLEKLKRGHTAEQNLKAARWIHQAGFTPHVDFVFGFPGETLGDRGQSLFLIEAMIEELGARIHAHTFMPLPGTPLFPETPSVLDDPTRNSLRRWQKMGKLDGWWEEQEKIAWKIVEWRDRGVIKERGSPSPRPSPPKRGRGEGQGE